MKSDPKKRHIVPLYSYSPSKEVAVASIVASLEFNGLGAGKTTG